MHTGFVGWIAEAFPSNAEAKVATILAIFLIRIGLKDMTWV